MSKFKVGDRVRCVKIIPESDLPIYPEFLNLKGTVIKTKNPDSKRNPYVVILDNKGETWFKAGELELDNESLIKEYLGIKDE